MQVEYELDVRVVSQAVEPRFARQHEKWRKKTRSDFYDCKKYLEMVGKGLQVAQPFGRSLPGVSTVSPFWGYKIQRMLLSLASL